MPSPLVSLDPRHPASRHPNASLPPLVGRDVPPVRRVPMALARRFFQICTTATAEALTGRGLTPLQYAVLAYLIGEPDIDQSGLAARLGIDRNTTSVLVDELEAKGLLTRRVNGADRRARLLRLTARGQKLHTRVQPLTFAGQQAILSVLASDEREILLDLLVRLIEGNRILARPGSGRRKRGSRQSPSDKT